MKLAGYGGRGLACVGLRLLTSNAVTTGLVVSA